MKAYPAYRGSGLRWLDQIPAHWESLPNIAIFDERIERGFVNDELLSVTQDRGIIKQSELHEKKDTSNEDKSAYKKVRVGDIAYNKMRMWQGAVGHSPFDGIISPAYVVLKPKRAINPRFYHYLLRTPAYIKESYRNSYGICDDQLSLRYFNFKRMISIVLPIKDQDAIVSFLEAKEAEIQKFIANQQWQIELLKEHQMTIINRLATKGIDDCVPMRDSGFFWLGKIPAKWTLRRFKFLTRIESGQVDPKDNAYENQVLIAPNHIESGTGEILYTETAKEQGAISGKYRVRRGELIYCKIRPNLRKVAIAPFDCLCSADMYPVSVIPEIKPQFLLYLILSDFFTKFAVDASMRVAMPKINREALGNCWIAYPGYQEQEEILKAIEERSQPSKKAISSAEQQITKMEEYRTALISAAVTGKIDVRNM